jgi:DNA-binding GntR family transcriptional regulator
VVDEVLRELRALVLSGALRPGERMVEERLTEQLGVSRAPLREALRILERDGLVRSLPRRGVIVEPLTADDVREIYSLRWALERLAVELGVPVRNPERLVPLRGALDEMRAAAESDDADGVVRANAAFHMALVDLPGHTRLRRAYSALAMQLEMCMAMNLRFRAQQYPGTQDSVRRHERLLQLIEAGDREALEHEIGAHGQNAFMDQLEELIGVRE